MADALRTTRRTFLGGTLALGACAGLPVRTHSMRRASRIGMGTYTLGEDPARHDEQLAALRLGIELGLTHIDTAEMYGDGNTETLVGDAIRGQRQRVFLCSKVHPDHANSVGTEQACRASLQRLGADSLDLYLLHLRPTRYPLAETMAALESLVVRGLVRAIGVSNFDNVELLDEARRALRRVPLACNQVKDALFARTLETTLAPYCHRYGIALVGYTPFAAFPVEGSEPHALLTRIGQRHGASAHQVALAFLSRDGILQIPRADSIEHVRDNAAALRIELSADDIRQLATLL